MGHMRNISFVFKFLNHFNELEVAKIRTKDNHKIKASKLNFSNNIEKSKLKGVSNIHVRDLPTAQQGLPTTQTQQQQAQL